MRLTSAQQKAVTARGNVLVVAGAGTGKTRTLVERCLSCLLEMPRPASLDEILMVTFTEAAAAEMRERIRSRMDEQVQAHPADLRWQEQLALLDSAHIGTLHSFCLKLVRQHFYELEIDPQSSVLSGEEARLLADETLESMMQRHFAGEGSLARAVQEFIETQARGWDVPVRALVLKLHHYTQTLPDPAGWFETQLALYGSGDPGQWRIWFREGVSEWCGEWRRTLEDVACGNCGAAECGELLALLERKEIGTEIDALFERICLTARNAAKGAGEDAGRLLKRFGGEATFLLSLARTGGAGDPLAQDWEWVRPQMVALLRLAQEFAVDFTAAKRELGVLDFHDLEQYALKLLWDRHAGQPTSVAKQWRERLKFILVDEYQDINAAQDRIIEALSREGAQANRFLVGDVKQSIYGFRLASPSIFRRYCELWRGRAAGTAIALNENFRSREAVLSFVNSLFELLMRQDGAGMVYDDEARLRFGASDERGPLGLGESARPQVELHLCLKDGNAAHRAAGSEEVERPDEIIELMEAEREARLVATRLRDLRIQGQEVWDDEAHEFRPVEWSDMAVLLRSPSSKAESYAKEFSRMGVPLAVFRDQFYQSMEIFDLLNLLRLLDNPLQDLPALAVLRSPLVGLSLDELASVRISAMGVHFWMALQRWHDRNRRTSDSADGISTGARMRVAAFLERFSGWRRLVRQASLSRCLETILAETRYLEWLATQPRRLQRCENVRRFLGLAQQFDRFQRQGLFRFLQFVEAQQQNDTGPEPAAGSEDNAVRLTSIHRSKGLEFPIVVIADLGKTFNFSDLHDNFIVDEKYGLCSHIRPPGGGQPYPSLVYWLAQRRQKREILAEELRLLYVAATRARDLLVLTANLSESRFERLWQSGMELDPMLNARSCADWIGLWWSKHVSRSSDVIFGESALLRWWIHRGGETGMNGGGAGDRPLAAGETPGAEACQDLERRLAWRYAFSSATRQPAKTSVSALRRQAAEDGEDAAPLFHSGKHSVATARDLPGASGSKTPQEIGEAHHRFMQLVSLDRVGNVEELGRELLRLEDQQLLTSDDVACIDLAAIAAFWQSEFGCQVRVHAPNVEREHAFTARFSAEEIRNLGVASLIGDLGGEILVVQGVADLVVLLADEIWLVDFKTDAVRMGELQSRAKLYEPQLRLYAQALARIYRRPVTDCRLYFFSTGSTLAIRIA